MNKTFIPATNYNKRKWYIIDCKDKQLGRLASTIIPLLTGKSKSVYHPSVDVGDYVILINSETLAIFLSLFCLESESLFSLSG